MKKTTILLLVACSMLLASGQAEAFGFSRLLNHWTWQEINDEAPWDARAGLRVEEMQGKLYLMGGRSPIDPLISPAPGASTIWGDVWRSNDKGLTWDRIVATEDPGHWPARAYFQTLTKGRYMYVIGGQNFELIPNPDPNGPPFLSVSRFFNDVWRSRDGENWQQMTAEAEWEGRAGLSAVRLGGKIYVMGGSLNDDAAVIGGPPARIYFNDVWSSRDGVSWELETAEAPWAKRAGAVVVARGGWMYLFGGEDGFTCLPGGRCPPYYNDVWRSRDGANWELVTAEAPWSSRPGHQVVKVNGRFVLFGGFGLSPDPADPFAPANPMDMWTSQDGANWHQLDAVPWNAADPAGIKYDFAAIATRAGRWGGGTRIMTFGGDRETFDFMDFTNYLNVDNDVWSFAMPRWGHAKDGGDMPALVETGLHAATPNPFNPSTTIAFSLAGEQRVRLAVFDVGGRLVKTLADGVYGHGTHEFVWQGRDAADRPVASGVYLYQLQTGGEIEVRRMVLVE